MVEIRKLIPYGLAIAIIAGLVYVAISISPCIEPIFGNERISLEAMELLATVDPNLITVIVDYDLTRRDAFGILWLRIYNNSPSHSINIMRGGSRGVYAKYDDAWRALNPIRSISVVSNLMLSPFHSNPILPGDFVHYPLRFRELFGRICGHDFMWLREWDIHLLHETGHPLRMYQQVTAVGFR